MYGEKKKKERDGMYCPLEGVCSTLTNYIKFFPYREKKNEEKKEEEKFFSVLMLRFSCKIIYPEYDFVLIDFLTCIPGHQNWEPWLTPEPCWLQFA